MDQQKIQRKLPRSRALNTKATKAVLTCMLHCRIITEVRLNHFHQGTNFWMLRKILSKSTICWKIWLEWPNNKECFIKFLPIKLLRVKGHFSHQDVLLFTKKLAKNWILGGALRVAPVCSTPNTSLLSNLAVYNAERSALHQGSCKMVSGGPGRASATRAARPGPDLWSCDTLSRGTRDWSEPEPL